MVTIVMQMAVIVLQHRTNRAGMRRKALHEQSSSGRGQDYTGMVENAFEAI